MDPTFSSLALLTRVQGRSAASQSVQLVSTECVVNYNFYAVVSLKWDLWQSIIFPKAGEMGASTTAAFTDYVTHLIAEEHGGAKYWVRPFHTRAPYDH